MTLILTPGRKHPRYLNGRLVFLFLSQLSLATLYSLRVISRDAFAFQWVLAHHVSTSFVCVCCHSLSALVLTAWEGKLFEVHNNLPNSGCHLSSCSGSILCRVSPVAPPSLQDLVHQASPQTFYWSFFTGAMDHSYLLQPCATYTPNTSACFCNCARMGARIFHVSRICNRGL